MVPAKTTAAELEKTLRMMDVADEIRRTRQRIEEHLEENDRETIRKQLLDRYRAMGHAADPTLLDAAIDTVLSQQNRFRPAVPGLGTQLAKLYVRRRHWARVVGIPLLVLILAVVGAFVIRQGVRSAREGRAVRAEQRMEETAARATTILGRVRQIAQEPAAKALAESHHADALQAAAVSDRSGLDAATERLDELLKQLEQAYTMVIVRGRERDSVRHYLIVQALADNGQLVDVKIRNEESGVVELVTEWGERVSRDVYERVAQDHADDRVIENNVFGHKRRGFMEPERLIESAGQITRW